MTGLGSFNTISKVKSSIFIQRFSQHRLHQSSFTVSIKT